MRRKYRQQAEEAAAAAAAASKGIQELLSNNNFETKNTKTVYRTRKGPDLVSTQKEETEITTTTTVKKSGTYRPRKYRQNSHEDDVGNSHTLTKAENIQTTTNYNIKSLDNNNAGNKTNYYTQKRLNEVKEEPNEISQCSPNKADDIKQTTLEEKITYTTTINKEPEVTKEIVKELKPIVVEQTTTVITEKIEKSPSSKNEEKNSVYFSNNKSYKSNKSSKSRGTTKTENKENNPENKENLEESDYQLPMDNFNPSSEMKTQMVITGNSTNNKSVKPQKKPINILKINPSLTPLLKNPNPILKIPEYKGTNFVEDLISEINLMRRGDKGFLEDAEKYAKLKKIKYAFKDSLKRLVDPLLQKLKELHITQIRKNETLMKLAQLYMDKARKNPARRLYPHPQEELEADLKTQFPEIVKCKNYITDVPHPRFAVLEMLFGENYLGKNSDLLADKDIIFAGVQQCDIGESKYSIVIISDSQNEPKYEKIENADSLLEEINRARANPSAYSKFLSPNDKDKILLMSQVENAEPLIRDETLDKALENFINDNGNQISKGAITLDPSQYLENYNTNLTDVLQYTGDPFEYTRDFVVKELRYSNTKNDMLVNPKFKRIGIAKTNDGRKIIIYLTNDYTIDNGKNKNYQPETKIVYGLTRNIHRPEFTEDELLQLKNDFNILDTMKTGKIYPDKILLATESIDGFKSTNPLYDKALNELNNRDNNEKGVDKNKFIEAVKQVIADKNKTKTLEDNWEDIFKSYFENEKDITKKNYQIPKDKLKAYLKENNFELTDEEFDELIEKLDGNVGKDVFMNAIKSVELEKKKGNGNSYSSYSRKKY